ncbi:hypothetical protein Tco_0617197 [Tanacetum coccineum]
MTHQCSCLRPLVCSPFTVSDLFLSYAKMDLFAFINHAYPTKVAYMENDVAREEGASNYNVNEEGGDVAVADQTGKSDHIVQVGGTDIVVDDETQAIVSDKPKRLRKKRKAADGASGSGLPPKKLREDHGVSGDAGASATSKSLAVLQGLLDRSTLAAEIRATTAATIPFVTSSVTPTPEREGGGHEDSVAGPNLSSMPPPLVLTAAVATTIIVDVISALAPRADTGQSSLRLRFLSQDVDSETLHQIYIPKWNITNDSTLDDPDICHGIIDHLAPLALFSQLSSMDYEQLFAEFKVGTARQSCLGFEVRLRLEHELRGRKKFEDRCAMQAGWLKERDAEIASLKAQLSLKEAEAAEAIRLHVLEGQVAALESAAVATSLKSDKDNLIDQVSQVEGTCSGFRDEVMGYKLFKEQSEAVQGADTYNHRNTLPLHLEGHRPCYDKGMQLRLALPILPQRLIKFRFKLPPCPTAKTPEAIQLQPSPGQLMLPIHRLEDQVVIRETSLSFSQDVANARVQILKRNAASQQLSNYDAFVPLIETLSAENLVGEASTPDFLATLQPLPMSTTSFKAAPSLRYQ